MWLNRWKFSVFRNFRYYGIGCCGITAGPVTTHSKQHRNTATPQHRNTATPQHRDFWSQPVSRILCLYDDLSTRPTRRVGEQRHPLPIWPCFKRGLHGRVVTHVAGELLPHHFTLTPTNWSGLFLLHFPSGHPAPAWSKPRWAPCSVKSGLSSLAGRRPADSRLIMAGKGITAWSRPKSLHLASVSPMLTTCIRSAFLQNLQSV